MNNKVMDLKLADVFLMENLNPLAMKLFVKSNPGKHFLEIVNTLFVKSYFLPNVILKIQYWLVILKI